MVGPTSEPSGHRTSRSGDFEAGFDFGSKSGAARQGRSRARRASLLEDRHEIEVGADDR